MNDTLSIQSVKPVEPPLQLETTFKPELLEVDTLVRASAARAEFRCDGSGARVAVLDTGLNTTHVDFAGRVVAQRNYTADNGNDASDATDGQGHGTNVTGIICANDIHTGIAPGAGIVAIKVLPNKGTGSFASIRDALQWVIENRTAYDISAVCMSLGDSGNYQSDAPFGSDAIAGRLSALNAAGVVCCIAAGNDFYAHNSEQGMSYPSIFQDCISVGAVYDANGPGFSYQSGAVAHSSAADRITPFSQRLHADPGREFATDIFAPGAPVTSSGIGSDTGVSVQHGTSQATPVVTGVILLLQSYYKRVKGYLPSAKQVHEWLLSGAVRITDGDDEDDNVVNTGKDFARVDAYAALTACARQNAAAAMIKAGIGLRAPK